MKERIVITEELEIKSLKEIEKEYDSLFMSFPEYEVEQVPETWEELKELCRATGHYGIDIIKGDGALYKENIFVLGLSFRLNGNVEDMENNTIAVNRTPEQMLQIVKGLIGEE